MTPQESNAIRTAAAVAIARAAEECARAQAAVRNSKALMSRLERTLRDCGVGFALHLRG